MRVERSSIEWGTTTIPYQIERSHRRATVSLAIDPVRGLLVTAPQTTTIAKLDAVVRSKARWIMNRMPRDPGTTVCSREFVTGETFLYLGRQVRLRLMRTAMLTAPRLHSGWLELSLPSGHSRIETPVLARTALVTWYRRLAAERIPNWTAAWAKKLRVEYKKVLITDPAKRWGSCAGGILRFNWRIIQAPRNLVDYVIAHELVHLIHEHHDRTFWSTLGRLLPDYEDRKRRLKELGPRLVW